MFPPIHHNFSQVAVADLNYESRAFTTIRSLNFFILLISNMRNSHPSTLDKSFYSQFSKAAYNDTSAFALNTERIYTSAVVPFTSQARSMQFTSVRPLQLRTSLTIDRPSVSTTRITGTCCNSRPSGAYAQLQLHAKLVLTFAVLHLLRNINRRKEFTHAAARTHARTRSSRVV